MTATITTPRRVAAPPSGRSRARRGSTVELWEIADAGHTAGLRTHPAEYERRTTTFLHHALGLQETP